MSAVHVWPSNDGQQCNYYFPNFDWWQTKINKWLSITVHAVKHLAFGFPLWKKNLCLFLARRRTPLHHLLHHQHTIYYCDAKQSTSGKIATLAKCNNKGQKTANWKGDLKLLLKHPWVRQKWYSNIWACLLKERSYFELRLFSELLSLSLDTDKRSQTFRQNICVL